MQQEYEVDEVGVLSPNQMQVDELVAGEVQITLSIKNFMSWTYEVGD